MSKKGSEAVLQQVAEVRIGGYVLRIGEADLEELARIHRVSGPDESPKFVDNVMDAMIDSAYDMNCGAQRVIDHLGVLRDCKKLYLFINGLDIKKLD